MFRRPINPYRAKLKLKQLKKIEKFRKKDLSEIEIVALALRHDLKILEERYEEVLTKIHDMLDDKKRFQQNMYHTLNMIRCGHINQTATFLLNSVVHRVCIEGKDARSVIEDSLIMH